MTQSPRPMERSKAAVGFSYSLPPIRKRTDARVDSAHGGEAAKAGLVGRSLAEGQIRHALQTLIRACLEAHVALETGARACLVYVCLFSESVLSIKIVIGDCMFLPLEANLSYRGIVALFKQNLLN